jgi:hypothetical protein
MVFKVRVNGWLGTELLSLFEDQNWKPLAIESSKTFHHVLEQCMVDVSRVST